MGEAVIELAVLFIALLAINIYIIRLQVLILRKAGKPGLWALCFLTPVYAICVWVFAYIPWPTVRDGD